MLTEQTFARDSTFPSWWANSLGNFLSVSTHNFQVVKQDATHVVVPAGPGGTILEGAAIAIDGRWRYVESSLVRAMPGGAAGTYRVFATASDNNIVNTPAPFTDLTDYSFGLAITDAVSVPAGAALWRLVALVAWDGAQITRITSLVAPVGPHAAQHAAAGSDPLTPADIGAGAVVPLVMALPAVPNDGDYVDLLADTSRGIIWRFRYRQTVQPHKWEFIGGPALISEADGVINIAGGYANAADGQGPSIILPLDGDYDCHFGAAIFTGGVGVTTQAVSLLTSTGGVLDADAAIVEFDNALISVARRRRKTNLVGGSSVSLQYRGGSGSTAQNRWLCITPSRVG